ncbi:MAG: hypothetical protein Q4D82_01585 [Neisseria sp.]|nr:hypothetical protein [Neisseria sp.]
MKIHLFVATGLLLTPSLSYASCAELGQGICSHYQNNKLIKKGECFLNHCSNSSGSSYNWFFGNDQFGTAQAINSDHGNAYMHNAKTSVEIRDAVEVKNSKQFCVVSKKRKEKYCARLLKSNF